MNRSSAVVYLRRYGYAEAVPIAALASDDVAAEFLESEAGKAAVRAFQVDFGTAAVDGELGPNTERAMQAPRCGCTAAMLRPGSRLPQWPKRDWKSSPLLYAFEKFVPGIDPLTQRGLAKQGTEFWMEACGIWIREAKPGEKADVTLSTGSGRRDDFDGPSGTLAWAKVAGDLVKFDLGENWTVDGNGIGWLEVFTHEFGHTIGLLHNEDQREVALMDPFYKRGLYRPQPADVRDAQARYGKPTWTPSDPEEPDEPIEPPPQGDWKLTQQRSDLIVLRRR